MSGVDAVEREHRVDGEAEPAPAGFLDADRRVVGGMKEGMPPEVFTGIWGLVEGVLTPEDTQQLATRLGIA